MIRTHEQTNNLLFSTNWIDSVFSYMQQWYRHTLYNKNMYGNRKGKENSNNNKEWDAMENSTEKGSGEKNTQRTQAKSVERVFHFYRHTLFTI